MGQETEWFAASADYGQHKAGPLQQSGSSAFQTLSIQLQGKRPLSAPRLFSVRTAPGLENDSTAGAYCR